MTEERDEFEYVTLRKPTYLEFVSICESEGIEPNALVWAEEHGVLFDEECLNEVGQGKASSEGELSSRFTCDPVP